MLNNLYQKSKIWFAIMWIAFYVVLFSWADEYSVTIGRPKQITLLACLLLSAILIIWLNKNKLFETYGLCKSSQPARRFLYYIPLAVIASCNLWNGFEMHYPLVETVCYVLSMLFVGFIEEIIFRGFLFTAMREDNLKQAFIFSSLTFGLGHIVNLINGSGMDLLSNLLQLCYAVAIGFMFTYIFYKSGSLWACIIAHGVLNALSVFANETTMTTTIEIVTSIILCVLSLGYVWVMHRMAER